MFLSKVVHFFAVGFALYTLAMLYQSLTDEEIVEYTKNCRYCDKKITEKVRLDPMCPKTKPITNGFFLTCQGDQTTYRRNFSFTKIRVNITLSLPEHVSRTVIGWCD